MTEPTTMLERIAAKWDDYPCDCDEARTASERHTRFFMLAIADELEAAHERLGWDLGGQRGVLAAVDELRTEATRTGGER